MGTAVEKLAATLSLPRLASTGRAARGLLNGTLEGSLRKRSLVASGLALFVTVLLYLLPDVHPLLQNADSAVYNDQVDARNLQSRTTHWGYMMLGVFARTLLPGPTDSVMNFMTLSAGALGIVACFTAAHRATNALIPSVIASLTLLTVPAYLRGMVLSEVDVPLTVFLSASFALALLRKPVFSGLSFGAALVISPLAGLTLAGILVVIVPEADGKLRVRGALKRLTLFGVASFAMYAPVVLANWQDYVYGGRGILHASRKNFDVVTRVHRSAEFLYRQCGPLLLLWGLGFIVGLRRRRYVIVFAPVVGLLVATLLGERLIDVPVQLPTIALMVPLCALALGALWRGRGQIVVSAIACSVVLAGIWRGFESTHSLLEAQMARMIAERDAYIALAESSRRAPLLVNIKGYDQGRRVERMVFGSAHPEHALSRKAFQRRCKRLASARGHFIWFVASPHRLPCAELEASYQVQSRTLNGRRFKVLIPRTG
ncbi:MAG TPA: hypothetical protein VFQ61_25520 [Polyangiaceae bacterium]|nr:hypothetical protein [Polyangiaceae bacterium]